MIAALPVALFAAAVTQPFLDRHCVSCHNTRQKTANLDLSAGATQAPAMWTKVRDKLAAGKMPPPGLPVPPKADIDSFLAALPATAPPGGPGRVTARRLNRTEYGNTIRDLLGLETDPAADFPVDDSGYGFDNNGDVLSVSPLLLEKYLATARKLSRVAVHGEALPPQPGVLTRLMARRSYDGGGLSGSAYLPYSMRGALYGSYVFPVDAEYELRFRAVNFRPDIRGKDHRTAWPTVGLQLTVDGQVVLKGAIEGSTTYAYDRGEFVARVPLKAGRHEFRASFPEFADLTDPRKNLNRDLRRQLFIDYLDIAGPFQPSQAPPATYQRLFVCGHAPGAHRDAAACSRTIVANLARRAFRRPPTPSEVTNLAQLAARVRTGGDSFEESIRVALQAVLVSPQFLFRLESSPPPGEPARTMAPLELASRLSYFLWASQPDDELLRAAEDGSLAQPETLARQARRMLADAKSRNLIDDFAAQWLQLRDLDRRRPDPQRFPALDDELIDAMHRETTLFAGAILREDRSVLEFLDAPFTFLNGPLASYYGIAGVTGEAFQRVALTPEAAGRGGLLGHGSVLTVSSYPTRTSPVMRGKWVLDNILGTPPPPPPADVPALEDAKAGVSASLREQLEKHRADPACAVCHDQMDGLGFALENYDAAGAWRTHDGKFPIDSSGALPGGRTIRGPGELKRVLNERADLFTRNLSEKLLTYALGRGLESYDETVVNGIAQQTAAGGHRFSALVLAIVNSAPFRHREAATPASGGKP